MRSSVKKSIVVAISLAAALTLSTSSASAKTRSNPVNQGRFEERFRDQDPVFGPTPVQRFVQIAKKVIVVIQELPVIPIP
jgi:hypothetical protein